METGYYSSITLSQCVASAKMQLRIEVTDEDIWLEKIANEAVRHMDALSIFVKRECTLTIEDGKAKLPNGFHRLLGLRLNCDFNYAGLYYIDTPFLNSCGCDNLGTSIANATGMFEIQSGYIIFGTDMSVTDPVTGVVTMADSVQCAFVGLNVDADGLMVVREDMERGVVAYLCYMYMKGLPDKYPAILWQQEEATWKAQKEWIKSVDVQNKFMNTRRQIAQIANAWVQDKTWFM